MASGWRHIALGNLANIFLVIAFCRQERRSTNHQRGRYQRGIGLRAILQKKMLE